MKTSLINLMLTLTLFLSSAAGADSISVIDPYVRAMPPGQKVTGAFMTLQNNGDSDRALVRAESDAAQSVELHEHLHNEGMMQMREVEKIDIAKGATTELKPGGLHVMLIGLTRPLQVDDLVTLKLVFDDGSEQSVEAPVKKILSGMGMTKE
jgi:periplasmic copper chaperone A